MRQRRISYNEVAQHDQKHRRRPRLRPREIYRLVMPYVSTRFLDLGIGASAASRSPGRDLIGLPHTGSPYVPA
jgi:hypothetical protein